MEYVCASSYTNLENLAHRPRGTPARDSLSLYGLDERSGRLTLLNLTGEKKIPNPAFIRAHPVKNLLYVVTESIKANGELVALSVCATTGQLSELARVTTSGRSACYITLSKDLKFIYVVNYWDSTMVSFPLDDDGLFLSDQMIKTIIPGSNVKNERAAHGDDPHSKHRLRESHAHAIVFEPFFDKLAYVPDLGEGCIKQFGFDKERKTAARYLGKISCNTPDAGPRYLEFHPTLNTIPTIPTAFPKTMNTCGRIAVDPSGDWLLVSNRGHDSIAVYKITRDSAMGTLGLLNNVTYYHTYGNTPRHFKFSLSGNWLLSANQDSNHIAVFRFDHATGALDLVHKYNCNSVNFIEVKRCLDRKSTLPGALPSSKL